MKQEENIESQQKNSENKVLDSIVSQLSSMTIEQIYNVMHKMKELVAKHPEQEKEKLVKNPQLSIALLQAQMVLGMINGISITDVPKKDIQKKIENLIQTVLSTWPQRDSSLNFEHQTPQKTSDNIKQKISKMDSIDDAKKSSLLFTDPTRSNLQANQNGISFLPSFNSSTHFPSQFPLQPNFNQNFSSLPSFLNPSLNVLPPLSANSFQVQKAQFQLFLKDLFSSPEKMNSLTNEQKEQLQLMMRYYQLN
ncbi:hydroxyproline-rich glycoprotein family protein [Anaeramoeba ignava]|uniref:Hydroxyproline-rich glycoprotein family protein n=1 Tax=Anaeramoeba ignava TaxID=1746090 RepID=A0A9Q0LW00_ANAIG|nr:hydroxyproline-rich glycoprotein family protein [Anaeramoeba ignava]